MARVGPFMFATIFTLISSLALLTASLATRKWLTGTIYGFKVNIGLFDATIDDQVVSIEDNFRDYKDYIIATACMVCIGMAFILLATISLIVFCYGKTKKATMILIYFISIIIGGILILIGACYFSTYLSRTVGVKSYQLVTDYCLVLVYISFFLVFGSLATITYALKSGEADVPAITDRATTTSIPTNIQYAQTR